MIYSGIRISSTFLIVTMLCPLWDARAADGGDALYRRIDRLIAAADPQFASLAAANSSDAEFFRRLYLDLAGTIPSAKETRAFLADATPSAERRTKLIDRLLKSPLYARRMQHVFDEMLMERRPAVSVPDEKWRAYLRDSFAANKSWKQLALEILAADGADEKLRPAAKFYLDRNFKVDLLTRDIGRLFLGVDLECAQCHDHPAIDDYLQRHYYGISAFLKRSYLFTDPKTKQKMLGEKAEGGDTKFTSVFTDEASQTDPRLLNLPAISDPKGMDKQYLVEPKKNVRGVPGYSRRQQLAWAMIADDNVAFRKNIVNRLWAMMMGRGLAEPLDVRHADNPPSHPEVLDLLADEFLNHDYDIAWLLKELALTETYQRSSRPNGEANEASLRLYAVGLLKPLSPEQLGWSIMQATGVTDRTLAAQRAALLKSDPKFGPGRSEHPLWREQVLRESLKENIDQFVLRFAAQGGQKTTFDTSAEQALFVINGPLVQSWLLPQDDNLTGRLKDMENPRVLAEELYITLLTRPPSDSEAAEVADYLEDVGTRDSAVQELVWALLSSAEFRFNH